MDSQEQTGAAVAADYNPFDTGNMATGGGLWDGKKVTITRAIAKIEALVYGDGKPVIDEKTHKQSLQIGLFVSGIAEGEEKERTEPYTCGDKLTPDADGESFSSKDGTPPKFHVNSGLGKFVTALISAGFPVKELQANPAKYVGQQKWSKLVGAQIVFKAEAKRATDGTVRKDKKGYDKNFFLPVKFEGMAAGVVQSGGTAAASSPTQDAIVAKASDLVMVALAGGPLGRAALVQQLAQKLVGDPDSNAIIQLVVRDDFHKGKAWKYDGVNASL